MRPATLSLAALALVAASAPARAQGPGQPITPGYWESTNELLSPIRSKKVERRCLKPSDIDKFMAGPSNHHYDCDYPLHMVEDGRIQMAGVCVNKKDGRRVKVSGEGSYTPTSFQITARIATAFLGIPVSGRASTDARRLGDACPADAEGTTLK
jgi:hypothetical protein